MGIGIRDLEHPLIVRHESVEICRWHASANTLTQVGVPQKRGIHNYAVLTPDRPL